MPGVPDSPYNRSFPSSSRVSVMALLLFSPGKTDVLRSVCHPTFVIYVFVPFTEVRLQLPLCGLRGGDAIPCKDEVVCALARSLLPPCRQSASTVYFPRFPIFPSLLILSFNMFSEVFHLMDILIFGYLLSQALCLLGT